ncbi:MAG: hypothetical protein IJD61_03640, partial [Clostridia bacterium]|nr:hypothetical protein [Clostridia bacterium]
EKIFRNEPVEIQSYKEHKEKLQTPDEEVLAEEEQARLEREAQAEEADDGFYHPVSVLPDIPQADPDPEEDEY